MGMIRGIKLQIKKLESDLYQLQKDYEDVANKARFESNPQEQNNLELQLENIAQQMENKEVQLNQKLKQLEDTKDNTQTLIQLLNPFENEIITYVKKAYHACSPEDWLNPVPDTLTGVFDDLEKMPQGRSKYTRIERWVGYLVTEFTDSKLPPSVYYQLTEWC
ncbi:MAG: hypothetical protein F6K50_47075, partial [Moorea sp. SIO3I7]|nr:hypothetical protein [Moorena sp. SIO3I7]